MKFSRWGTALAVAGVALLSACGSGSGSSSSSTQMRLINASVGYPSLDLTVNANKINSAIAYGQAGAYAGVETNATSTLVSPAGSPTPVATTTPALAGNSNYSLIAYGWQGAVRTALLQETQAAPEAGKTTLLVLNLAPDAGAVDVYLTGANDSLDNAAPMASSIAGGNSSGYNTVASGTYRVRLTGTGSKSDVRLDLPAVLLDSQKVNTLILTPTSGGVFVNGLLLAQQGSLTAFNNSNARARVVASVPGGVSVAATLDGASLLSTPISPAIGDYRSVASGTRALSVTVNGIVQQVQTPQLAAGADYTVLVWGAPGAPSITVLADDNRAPVTSGQAKVRLLNGLAEPQASLTLAMDFTPLASNVAPGTASTPATVSASTGALLQVSSLTNLTAYQVPNAPIANGGVYTVYMLGSTTNPQGVLRRDR